MISKSLRYKKTKLSREEMLNNISSDFAHEFSDDIFLENISSFYNTNELKDIYFIKLLLKDFKELLNEIDGNKNFITEYVEKSNRMYAYSINSPAFHKESNCQWMKSDFENIIIPLDCRLDTEKKTKALEWLKKNKGLSFSELNSKFKIEFECDCDLEEVKKQNSGHDAFDNTQIKLDLYKEVNEKFRQMRMFFNGEFAKKVQSLKYAPSFGLKKILKNNTNDPYYDTIIDFHTMKESVLHMIINYYQNKFNIDLSFDQPLLESIGFRACSGCQKTT